MKMIKLHQILSRVDIKPCESLFLITCGLFIPFITLILRKYLPIYSYFLYLFIKIECQRVYNVVIPASVIKPGIFTFVVFMPYSNTSKILSEDASYSLNRNFLAIIVRQC